MGSLFLKLSLVFSFSLMACSSLPERSENYRKPAHIVRAPLIWPISKRTITRQFKDEDEGRPHDGIDIRAPEGTRIYAPANGRILYAGRKFKGYGKMLIIEHNSILSTIYGHCKKLLVKSGEEVKKGSLIALVGQTGRASAPHLHFEVRKNLKPVDPLEFLP